MMLILSCCLFAQAPRMEPQPSSPAVRSADPEQIKRFNAALRSFLITNLPDPLYEKRTGDGKTARTANGITWKGLRPKIQYAEKNDGPRRHLLLTAERLPQTLQIAMKHVQLHEGGRTTFDLELSLAARLNFEEERWKNGVRLYDGKVRARLTVWINLHCESRLTTQMTGFLPTFVYRLKVNGVDFIYTDLVFEHVPGLGGEAARIVGDLAVDALKQWKPSVEKQLLEKLEERVVKAADTKEIRIGLGALSGKQAPTKQPQR